jgi:hypothetical protein
MAEHRPLILDGGRTKQLPEGDTIVGASGSSSTSAEAYIHSQPGPATQWTIQHDLNNQNLLIQCWADDNTLLTPTDITIVDDNNVTLDFGSASAGRAVITPVLEVGEGTGAVQAPTLGLVAEYKFEDVSGSTITDTSGNGNNATHASTPILVSSYEPRLGNAIDLNGSASSWIDTGVAHAWSAATVSFWVKITNTGAWQDIFSTISAGYALWSVRLSMSLDTTGQLQFNVGNGATAWTKYLATDIGDGGWHHVVQAVDGTDSKLYVDAVLVSDDTASVALAATPGTTNYYFGKFGAVARYTAQQLDQIRFYDRQLNQTDVNALYNEGIAPSTARTEYYTVGGGASGNSSPPTNAVEHYDPADSWSAGTSCPIIWGYMSAQDYGGKWIAAGGTSTAFSVGDGLSAGPCYEYDGASWGSNTDLGRAAQAPASGVDADGYHVIGGSNTNTHDTWDGAAWATDTVLPTTRWAVTGGFNIEGRIHTPGGLAGAGGSPDANHYGWDGASWASYTNTRGAYGYSCGYMADNSRFYHIGGYGPSWSGSVNAFDGTNWTAATSVSAMYTMSGGHNGTDAMHVGNANAGSPGAGCATIDDPGNSWTTRASMATGRYAHSYA